MAARQPSVEPAPACVVIGCNAGASMYDGGRGRCKVHHFQWEEDGRMKRWIARGKPTAEQSIAEIKRLNHAPKMTNLERAHLILSQDAPNLIALEWAREYLLRHATQGEANGK